MEPRFDVGQRVFYSFQEGSTIFQMRVWGIRMTTQGYEYTLQDSPLGVDQPSFILDVREERITPLYE